MKLSSKDFFSKRNQIRGFLRIWSHLLKKSLTENFIFCAVIITKESSKIMYLKRLKYPKLFLFWTVKLENWISERTRTLFICFTLVLHLSLDYISKEENINFCTFEQASDWKTQNSCKNCHRLNVIGQTDSARIVVAIWVWMLSLTMITLNKITWRST